MTVNLHWHSRISQTVLNLHLTLFSVINIKKSRRNLKLIFKAMIKTSTKRVVIVTSARFINSRSDCKKKELQPPNVWLRTGPNSSCYK